MAQGTIKHYDIEQHTGSLLMDDRTEVRIDAWSTKDSGLRYLRIGQRVRFEVAELEGEKYARELRILTID
jgi:cold shock CspA family protein